MNTKNLMYRAVKRVNRFTIEDLAIDLVELSERDLQHINGGVDPRTCSCGRTVGCTEPPLRGPGRGCEYHLFQANNIQSSQTFQANETLTLTASGEFDFVIG